MADFLFLGNRQVGPPQTKMSHFANLSCENSVFNRQCFFAFPFNLRPTLDVSLNYSTDKGDHSNPPKTLAISPRPHPQRHPDPRDGGA